MNNYCPAWDYGVAVFPDQKIRPCCQVSADYSKPLESMTDKNRFADLKTQEKPSACQKCWDNEDKGIPSYRKTLLSFQNTSTTGIKFLDLRHSNQCNLKCRYCNPHFSNQWAKELNYQQILQKSDISRYLDDIITKDLEDVYWCGGEPLMIKDHVDILEKIIEQGLNQNISLRYNTNLTLLNYKDVDIINLWKKFKNVNISVSLDAAAPVLNHIRSGSSWDDIRDNIEKLLLISQKIPNIFLSLAPTVSMLNVWFLPELLEYANNKKIKANLNILTYPDYLSLDAIPVQLQNIARQKIESVKQYILDSHYREMMRMLIRDDNEYLFLHAVRHILLLDKLRNENLFDFLPFKELAIELTLKNHEYE